MLKFVLLPTLLENGLAFLVATICSLIDPLKLEPWFYNLDTCLELETDVIRPVKKVPELAYFSYILFCTFYALETVVSILGPDYYDPTINSFLNRLLYLIP